MRSKKHLIYEVNYRANVDFHLITNCDNELRV